jgi:hypothetical protein
MGVDLMPIIPSSYLKPNFGDNKCWFSSKWHDFVLINKTLWRRNLSYKGNYISHVHTEYFYHWTQYCTAGNKNITHSTVTSLVIRILSVLTS